VLELNGAQWCILSKSIPNCNPVVLDGAAADIADLLWYYLLMDQASKRQHIDLLETCNVTYSFAKEGV
jgi:hypothetical protein